MIDSNLKPVILFRESPEVRDEFNVAARYFPINTYRDCCKDNLVIGRYSVLPYYKELQSGLFHNNSVLINSFYQHKWIANFDYYELLKNYTFETWFDLRELPDCPMVVKGRTNSRKARWNTHMFAPNRKAAVEIALELMQDPMLGEQGIIFRRYEKLETLEIGLNDQPFVNEHRIFYLNGVRLAHGFYWSIAENKKEIDQEGLDFADEIAKLVSGYVNFFVLDVAKTETGKWKLVEVNDAQMAGLSCIDPDELYKNLHKEIFK